MAFIFVVLLARVESGYSALVPRTAPARARSGRPLSGIYGPHLKGSRPTLASKSSLADAHSKVYDSEVKNKVRRDSEFVRGRYIMSQRPTSGSSHVEPTINDFELRIRATQTLVHMIHRQSKVLRYSLVCRLHFNARTRGLAEGMDHYDSPNGLTCIRRSQHSVFSTKRRRNLQRGARDSSLETLADVLEGVDGSVRILVGLSECHY